MCNPSPDWNGILLQQHLAFFLPNDGAKDTVESWK
jgi:hypothetical protein